MYENYIKFILDKILAIIALILLSPIILITALIIKIKEWDSPVLFIQERSGIYRKPFKCYKFRSMSTSAPKNASTWELENPENYITPFGAFMRKTSLDELPQLFNILKGDMSFVGPRPVILKETELLDLREKYGACKVKPGITGLSQISGRDNLPPRQKAKMDGLYAGNVNFIDDMKLFLKTIPAVIFGEGIREGKINDEDFK
ncbi:sugar transferase [Anaerococcus sp. AGMB00486]|uniref:Sugar transferase n=2 Tax=Anaerococcus TaxID=165779 RepID=A0ABX2NBT3_9FIRM|nr:MULTISPECIES: sugar transferase [Anaerococcus]MDY3006644.1 sugar transferase [Anaerococcus porci]MSS78111.1 sugar transferase [Anaerococcus porci]NVF12085.1 sugar transferase [Anaerococcus faecalis]